jgi:hypothetical protein
MCRDGPLPKNYRNCSKCNSRNIEDTYEVGMWWYYCEEEEGKYRTSYQEFVDMSEISDESGKKYW